jgi:hypothetical protein
MGRGFSSITGTAGDRRDPTDIYSKTGPSWHRNANRVDRGSFGGYCEKVKNITVSVEEDTYRRARIKAAELDTSVSALVKQFLIDLVADGGEADRLAREERDLRERIGHFRASDRLARDELHDRRR